MSKVLKTDVSAAVDRLVLMFYWSLLLLTGSKQGKKKKGKKDTAMFASAEEVRWTVQLHIYCDPLHQVFCKNTWMELWWETNRQTRGTNLESLSLSHILQSLWSENLCLLDLRLYFVKGVKLLFFSLAPCWTKTPAPSLTTLGWTQWPTLTKQVRHLRDQNL